jgi:hypothetical protein
MNNSKGLLEENGLRDTPVSHTRYRGTAPRPILETTQRNPGFGCPLMVQHFNLAFKLALDKDIVRRILSAFYIPDPEIRGRSYLSGSGSTIVPRNR